MPRPHTNRNHPTATATATGPTATPTATATLTGAQKDRAALEALYDATDGDNWSAKTNWKSIQPLSSWHGVTTNGDGRVNALYLSSNSLSGALPSKLADLTGMEFLYLNNNDTERLNPDRAGRPRQSDRAVSL